MERLKDQKADQKRLSPGTPFGDRSLQGDFGFIEAALKCLHTVYKICNRIQYPCAGAGDDLDGHPAASRSAMPCPAPSMPEIAPFIVPT